MYDAEPESVHLGMVVAGRSVLGKGWERGGSRTSHSEYLPCSNDLKLERFTMWLPVADTWGYSQRIQARKQWGQNHIWTPDVCIRGWGRGREEGTEKGPFRKGPKPRVKKYMVCQALWRQQEDTVTCQGTGDAPQGDTA